MIAPAKLVGAGVGSTVGLLIGTGSVTAVLQFGETVSVTAIIVAAGVVVLGGVFTLRNNMRSFWRDLAEERKEQIAQLEDEVRTRANDQLEAERTHTADLAKVIEEQREIRHGLKTKLAELGHQLDLEKAKHDLSEVTGRLQNLEDLAVTRGAMFERIDHNESRQIELLTVIVKHLVPDYNPDEEAA